MAARNANLSVYSGRGRYSTEGVSLARISATAERSFCERIHGLRILLVCLGPGAHMRQVQVLEGAIDCSPSQPKPLFGIAVMTSGIAALDAEAVAANCGSDARLDT
jgi:hypothetical protein